MRETAIVIFIIAFATGWVMNIVQLASNDYELGMTIVKQ